MKRWMKYGIVFGIILLAVLIYVNRAALEEFYLTLLAGNWWVAFWIVVIFIVIIALYYFGEYFDIWRKLKMRKRFTPGERKTIPQPVRHEEMKQWCEDNWEYGSMIMERGNAELTLLDNKITPNYPNADKYEVAIWTVERAKSDRRLTTDSVPEDKRIILVYDCRSGEIESLPRSKYHNMWEAWEFVMQKFKDSIPRELKMEKEREFMEKVFEGTAFEIGKQKAGDSKGEEGKVR